jgi:hypothetical protein
MNFFVFITALIFATAVSAQSRPIEEKPPKFEVDAPANAKAPGKGEKSNLQRGKRTRFKAPRKVFPPSEKNKENPDAPKSLDEQIKDADRSDLEPE